MKRQLAIDGRAIPEKDLLAQLLGIIDRLKDGMLILDNDHRIIYANAEIEQILLNQGLTGKNISEVNLGEIRPNFIYNLRIAIAERRKVSFIEYIKPRKMWYNVCIYTSTTLMLVVFQDMSDVERLKEQYKLTRYTIDNAQEYVMWVSMNGRISFVNGPTRRKLGYEMASKADILYTMSLRLSPLISGKSFETG
jgi:PAS domain-containing protein